MHQQSFTAGADATDNHKAFENKHGTSEKVTLKCIASEGNFVLRLPLGQAWQEVTES